MTDFEECDGNFIQELPLRTQPSNPDVFLTSIMNQITELKSEQLLQQEFLNTVSLVVRMRENTRGENVKIVTESGNVDLLLRICY